jgi:hypothetical protein
MPNRKNRVLEELLTGNEDLEIVGKIMWSRACQIVLEDSIMNAGDVQISSKQWSRNTKELYLLINQICSFHDIFKVIIWC